MINNILHTVLSKKQSHFPPQFIIILDSPNIYAKYEPRRL